jgi:hypothetical protein
MIIYPKDKFAARPFIFTLLLAEFFWDVHHWMFLK